MRYEYIIYIICIVLKCNIFYVRSHLYVTSPLMVLYNSPLYLQQKRLIKRNGTVQRCLYMYVTFDAYIFFQHKIYYTFRLTKVKRLTVFRWHLKYKVTHSTRS